MNMKQCECGGIPALIEVEIEEDDSGEYTFEMYYVRCDKCGKTTPELEFSEENAIKIWNEQFADIPKDKMESRKYG